MENGNLSKSEADCLQHVMMWGSAAYPVRKRGSRWFVDTLYGVGASPVAYRTKTAATDQFEAFLAILRDKKAGRLS